MSLATISEAALRSRQTSVEDPDAPAIRRVLAGESAAFSEVIERHERALRRFILGVVSDQHLAEDVLQEVFLIAYRRLCDFRFEARFGTWLYRIALREATRMRTRWHRLRTRFVRVGGDTLDSMASTVGSPEPLDLSAALSMLQKLRTQERAAFVLYVMEGRSYAEIADLLESRPGTVASWIHRARARLEEAVARSEREREGGPVISGERRQRKRAEGHGS